MTEETINSFNITDLDFLKSDTISKIQSIKSKIISIRRIL
jgi:hypothetical protein